MAYFIIKYGAGADELEIIEHRGRMSWHVQRILNSKEQK